ELARRKRQVSRFLDRNAFFWNTVLSGLQTSALITLGRVFDTDSRSHRLDKLMSIASSNLAIFSKTALSVRLPLLDPLSLRQTASQPRPADFRRLKRQIGKPRKLSAKNAKEFRHKMLAHKEVVDKDEITALLSGTRVSEIQRIIVFLISLHKALSGLYQNGLK